MLSHKNPHGSLSKTDKTLLLQERALPAIDAAFEKTAGIGARIDLVLAKIRLAMFYNEKSRVESDIKVAQEYVYQHSSLITWPAA